MNHTLSDPTVNSSLSNDHISPSSIAGGGGGLSPPSPASDRPDPPSLTGGSHILHPPNKPTQINISVGEILSQSVCPSVDFLSITLPSSDVLRLLVHVRSERPLSAGRGFARRSRYDLHFSEYHYSGECSRSWEPVYPSSDYGMDYESWEFPGRIAVMALALVDSRGRPSRVDVCWDYPCRADTDPVDVLDYWSVPSRLRGVASQGGIATGYVGSPASDRRIRVYRVDRSPNHPDVRSPTLRVELVLRHDYARDWWSQPDWLRRHAMAAGHLRHMVGWSPVGVCVDPPPIDRVLSPAVLRVARMMRQYAGMLSALACAGVDLAELAALCHDSATRWSTARSKQIAQAVHDVGAQQFVRDVISLVSAER